VILLFNSYSCEVCPQGVLREDSAGVALYLIVTEPNPLSMVISVRSVDESKFAD